MRDLTRADVERMLAEAEAALALHRRAADGDRAASDELRQRAHDAYGQAEADRQWRTLLAAGQTEAR